MGLGILNPIKNADTQYSASKTITATLASSIANGLAFGTTEYKISAVKIHRKLSSERDTTHVASLKQQLVEEASSTQCQCLNRAWETGLCLTTSPETLNGTELSAEEFWDKLCLWYGLSLSSLLYHCDGCGTKFDV